MNDLSFENTNIRTTDNNGETWFVLRDVLTAMGSKTTTNDATESINQGLGEGYVSDLPLQTNGGLQETIIINESAVTYLVAQSRTKKGKKLNRWLHTEVLPAIRKTGGYQLKPKTRLELAREQLVLIEEIDRQEKLLELQAPKVEIANALIADAKLLSISEALAHYSINRKAGFELLKLSKWIYKKEQYDNVKTSIWLPTELARKNEWIILKQRVDHQNILRPQALVTALGLTEMRKLFY
jgi:prophage antirepressor-like protein